MIEAGYVDDQTLLANTSARTKSLLHNLEKVARGIGHNVLNKRDPSPLKVANL